MDVICSREGFFKNPQKLPLNELNFKYTSVVRTSKTEVTDKEISSKDSLIKWQDRYQVKEERKPALDKCWLAPEKRFVKFHPFYPQFSDKENVEFLRRNREFLASIKFLTDCTYHQFWCYMMCEPCTSIIIKSFLEHSISPYATSHLNQEFLELYNKIYSGIYHIYERLLCFNPSSVEYMPEDFVLSFFKKSKLLNVRTILILCYLYNNSKPQFITNIINFYFCEKYKDAHLRELEAVIIDFLEEFDKLSKLNMSSNHMAFYNTDSNDPLWLEHTASYLLDVTASLQEFLSVYTPAFDVAFTLQLPQYLPQIYQEIYLQFYDKLENKNAFEYDWSKCESLIKQWITLGRAEFVNLFYKFMNYLYEKLLEFKSVCPAQEKYLEIYCELIAGAFDDDLFIKDYNKVYPIKDQFQLLIDNVNNFDKTQSDYLLEILEDIIEKPSNSEIQESSTSNTNINYSMLYQNGEIPKPNTFVDVDEELYDSLNDTLSEYLHIQQSSTSETKVLPELIQIALNQYVQLMEKWENDMDPSDFEAASSSTNIEFIDNINKPSNEEIDKRVKSVLEMLPNLEVGYIKKCLERMDYRPEQVITRILDNDLPLDLWTSECFVSEIDMPGSSKQTQPKLVPVVSKKSNYKDTIHLLDDKKEKQDIKNLVLKASRIYDLDDDYDDRNEIYNGYESSDESKIYRHLEQSNTPECEAISDPSSSSEDEEPDEANIQNERSRNAFCEDPALVRARKEAQRNSRTFRGNHRNATNNNNNQLKQQKDSEANVKQSRDKKNTHKATRANHNRKGGAQWKRNRGMVPS